MKNHYLQEDSAVLNVTLDAGQVLQIEASANFVGVVRNKDHE